MHTLLPFKAMKFGQEVKEDEKSYQDNIPSKISINSAINKVGGRRRGMGAVAMTKAQAPSRFVGHYKNSSPAAAAVLHAAISTQGVELPSDVSVHKY